MTPKEKAKELVIKYLELTSKHKSFKTAGLGAMNTAKQCALIAVDEVILEQCKSSELKNARYQDERLRYWQEVKREIEKL